MNSSSNPLDTLISEAGFSTKKAFAEAAGLADYEISRIGLGPKQRRPTRSQLRKIASALRKKPAEIAAILLPEGGLEHEIASAVVQERDQLVSELGEVRGDLVATRAKLAEAEQQIVTLGRELNELQRMKEQLSDDIAQQRSRADGLANQLRETRVSNAKLAEENRKLQRLIDETQNKAQELKDEAAQELARLYGRLNDLRDELGRERAGGLQRQILAGSLGAIVGAIVRGAPEPSQSARGSRSHRQRKKP